MVGRWTVERSACGHSPTTEEVAQCRHKDTERIKMIAAWGSRTVCAKDGPIPSRRESALPARALLHRRVSPNPAAIAQAAVEPPGGSEDLDRIEVEVLLIRIDPEEM